MLMQDSETHHVTQVVFVLIIVNWLANFVIKVNIKTYKLENVINYLNLRNLNVSYVQSSSRC